MSWKTNALTNCFFDAVAESAAEYRAPKSRDGDSGDGNSFPHSVEDLDGEALSAIGSTVTIH